MAPLVLELWVCGCVEMWLDLLDMQVLDWIRVTDASEPYRWVHERRGSVLCLCTRLNARFV